MLDVVDIETRYVDLPCRSISGAWPLAGDYPSRWFYDDRGCALFETITQLEEYYPTRTETAILRDANPKLLRFAGKMPCSSNMAPVPG